jgi:hypothetical protein
MFVKVKCVFFEVRNEFLKINEYLHELKLQMFKMVVTCFQVKDECAVIQITNLHWEVIDISYYSSA